MRSIYRRLPNQRLSLNIPSYYPPPSYSLFVHLDIPPPSIPSTLNFQWLYPQFPPGESRTPWPNGTDSLHPQFPPFPQFPPRLVNIPDTILGRNSLHPQCPIHPQGWFFKPSMFCLHQASAQSVCAQVDAQPPSRVLFCTGGLFNSHAWGVLFLGQHFNPKIIIFNWWLFLLLQVY